MTQQARRFLRFKEVKELVGLGHSCIYEKIKHNAFPAPVPIGKRAVAWLSDEIENWMLERVSASRNKQNAGA